MLAWHAHAGHGGAQVAPTPAGPRRPPFAVTCRPSPVAVGMPRAFNAAAMARSDVVPATRSSATMAARSAARVSARHTAARGTGSFTPADRHVSYRAGAIRRARERGGPHRRRALWEFLSAFRLRRGSLRKGTRSAAPLRQSRLPAGLAVATSRRWSQRSCVSRMEAVSC